MGKNQKEIEKLLKNIEKLEKKGKYQQIAESYLNAGELYEDEGDLANAIEMYENVLALAKEGINIDLLSVYQALYEAALAYKEVLNFTNAYEALNTLSKILKNLNKKRLSDDIQKEIDSIPPKNIPSPLQNLYGFVYDLFENAISIGTGKWNEKEMAELTEFPIIAGIEIGNKEKNKKAKIVKYSERSFISNLIGDLSDIHYKIYKRHKK
ncbi:MAG: hypothetical protein ACTSU2_12960 [Promethearchaeota archaeon]